MHEKSYREMRTNLMSLLQFLPGNNRNMLDGIIGPTIENLTMQVDEICDQNARWEDMAEKFPEKLQESLDKMCCTKDDWYNTIRDAYIEASVMEDQLLALSETRIIYAFKNLELNMKHLILRAYPETSKRDIFNWDQLMDVLRAKGIRPEFISHYEETNQLRHLNNSLKHSMELNDQVRKIPEFKKAAVIGYEGINRFYLRVQDAPFLFLQSLCDAVWEERFNFDDVKLGLLSQELLIRLGDEHTMQLCARLIELHDKE